MALLRPLSSPSDMNTVIGFGMGLIFMVMITGLVRSLLQDALEPEKETPQIITPDYRQEREK